MSSLTFACKWVIDIRKAKCIFDAYKIALSLQSQLAVLERGRINEAKYLYDVYGIRVPSEAALMEFNQRIGQEMGMDQWYPISEDKFKTGKLLVDDNPEGVVCELYLAAIRFHGIVNANLRATEEGRNFSAISINKLGLSDRSIEILEKAGLMSVGRLRSILFRGEEFFYEIPNFDQNLHDGVLEKLREHNYWPKEGDKFIDELGLDEPIAEALMEYGLTSANELRNIVKDNPRSLLEIYDIQEENLEEIIRAVEMTSE